MVARRQEGGMQQVVQTRVITENKRRCRVGQRFQITFEMPLGPVVVVVVVVVVVEEEDYSTTRWCRTR